MASKICEAHRLRHKDAQDSFNLFDAFGFKPDVADGFRAARKLPKTQTKTRRPGSRRGWDWARRKGMGKEAIQHCESYSRRAEIRMGEMLAATERAKGTKALDAERKMGTMLVEKPPAIRWKPGPGRGKKASTSDALGFYVKQICESDNTPTLAELGCGVKRHSQTDRNL